MSIMETMARGLCDIAGSRGFRTMLQSVSGTMGASWLREWHLERRPASRGHSGVSLFR